MTTMSDLIREQANTRGKKEFNQAPTQEFSAKPQTQTLRDSVDVSMKNYFAHLDGQPVTDLYNMVISEVEAPLLESVMDYVRGNQTNAAIMLGLNRGTLRKKLKEYNLL